MKVNNSDRSLKIAIQQLAGTYNLDLVSIYACSVVSVDEDNQTIDCKPITGDSDAEIPNIQLTAEPDDTGLILFPTVGSTVIVGVSTKNTPFILLYSSIDTAKLVTDTLTQFNDGSFGGLAKTRELKLQLDKTNAVVSAIVQALTTWTPIPSDGGAALKTFATTALSGKAVGDYSNIENERITHGI